MTRRRVNEFVESLVRNRRPKRFRARPSDQAIMKAAIDLRAAHPDEGLPSPEFVAGLRDQLSYQILGGGAAPEPRISRRRWLVDGAIAASAVGVAVVADRTLFKGEQPRPQQAALSPDHGDWRTLADNVAVINGAANRFSTPGTVGFLTDDNGVLVAVSGVCSHQGCLLEYNEAERRLDCPCHRAAFSLTGKVLFSELPVPPPPLTRIAARRNGGQIQVYVPPT